MPNRPWIPLLLLVGCLSTAALGHESPAIGRLDERINIELVDAEAVHFFRSMAAINEAELELDPQVEGLVTIQLYEVTNRTILDAVCESLECRWSLDEGAPRRLVVKALGSDAGPANEPTGSLDTLVNLALRDAPAEQVFKSFASIGNWKLQLERNLVTVELEDMTVRDSLDVVCRNIGCRWSLDEADGQGVLRVEFDG